MSRLSGKKRAGAAVVETVLVILALLILIMGMLDLGVAVFRYHVLSNAARQTARKAIVRGALAPNRGNVNTWSPADYGNPYETTADVNNDLTDTVRPYLVGLDPQNVTIKVEWFTGNQPNGRNRVQVTVSAPYRPIMAFIFGPNASITERASSTMLIAH